MARPLARLARPGAGARGPRRQRQDSSGPCVPGALGRASSWRPKAWPRHSPISPRAIILDRAEHADAEAFLHLYNLMAERRGHLLILAREPPARWGIALADLRSRLLAAPPVALAAPDDELLAALPGQALRRPPAPGGRRAGGLAGGADRALRRRRRGRRRSARPRGPRRPPPPHQCRSPGPCWVRNHDKC